ncbi:Terpenoid synthase [Penicillium griseofulvum]|uniref:Terpenoid synthase n=1 Tax=Penicillium patulum TaxID=5078 RepID=A0A135LTD0_PENPA|nr:Terpenoid synthase [Penicillium griseofulvum]KXG52215.1 Terpenoid synthase [Penicillium griseofulvum]
MATCDYTVSLHHGIVPPTGRIYLPVDVTGHIPDYTRLNDRPVIRSCEIALGIRDVCLKLRIPHYNIVAMNSAPPSAVIYSHANFKASIQPEKAGDTKDFYERCFAEAAAINLFFPDVRSERIRICMTAWLAANCAADDILETMPPAAATLALKEAILKLRGKKTEVSPINKVASILCFFLEYCIQQLDLSESIARELSDDICDMCQGLLDELLFRRGLLSNNLKTYLQFRGKTMGIHPFFTLIRTLHKPIDAEYLSGLRDLQKRVSLVLGLQNDLVGLEKDRRNGETMNAVLVSLKEQAGTDVDHMNMILPKTIQDVCEIHNLCLSAAVEVHEGLQLSRGHSEEGILETTVLAFADTHLKWCASSKRYQAKVQ